MAHVESKASKQLPSHEVAPIDNVRQGTLQALAVIFVQIADALICIDRHWHYSYVTAQAEHVMGKTHEELLGRVVWEVWPTRQFGLHFLQTAVRGCV